MHNIKRAISLIRVSTKQQTDQVGNDIPDQREIVRKFVSEQGWILTEEFIEPGVSAYKKKAHEHEAIQKIKKMAKNKEFDILVVYSIDRLGRKSLDTLQIVLDLLEYGVIIWSLIEGDLSIKSHTDLLMLFIRTWQGEGESIKTSTRVIDFQVEAVENGRFRGGSFIPYGYMLLDNGKRNAKRRRILDFVVNTEEAEIVKLIYDLSINKNYGQSRIAQYLNSNGIKNRDENGWSASTIQYILANPIYKGQHHILVSKDNTLVLSDIQSELVIIPENDWDENRAMVEARTYKKKHDVNSDKRIKNTHGKMLLSGIVFCGYCGSALTTMTAQNNKKLADGTKTKTVYHKYRCASFYKSGAIKCIGPKTYATSKIEPIVISETKNFLDAIQSKNHQELYTERIEGLINDLERQQKACNNELNALSKKGKSLKDEIAKVLLGESVFSSEDLKGAMEQNKEKTKLNQNKIEEIQNKLVELNIKRNAAVSLDGRLAEWESQFDTMDFETKKAMLATLIDKIIVRQDSIEILYNIKLETYLDSCKDTQYVRVLA